LPDSPTWIPVPGLLYRIGPERMAGRPRQGMGVRWQDEVVDPVGYRNHVGRVRQRNRCQGLSQVGQAACLAAFSDQPAMPTR
jgi:hypothetical protein